MEEPKKTTEEQPTISKAIPESNMDKVWMNKPWKYLPRQSVVRAYLETDQSAGANVKVQFNTEDYDLFDEFDSIVNYRFTCKYEGFYFVSSCLKWASSNINETWGAEIRKNNVAVASAVVQAVKDGGPLSANVQNIVYLTKNDYIEIFTLHISGTNETVEGGTTKTYLTIFRIS